MLLAKPLSLSLTHTLPHTHAYKKLFKQSKQCKRQLLFSVTMRWSHYVEEDAHPGLAQRSLLYDCLRNHAGIQALAGVQLKHEDAKAVRVHCRGHFAASLQQAVSG